MAGTDHRHRFWRPTRAGQRGLALVMVLWTAVILALVAGSVTRLSRGDLQLVRNVTDATHAELAADAGLRRALYEIAAAPGTWRTDGGIYGWRFGDAELRVEVSDELGRIDINQASEALLAGLFDAAGAADPERIAAATTAYREARRTEAARVGGTGLRPASAFSGVGDLGNVPGLAPELLEQIAPVVTVYTGRARPVLASAPPLVRLAMDATASTLQTPFSAPGRAMSQLTETPALLVTPPGAPVRGSGLYRIHAEALASGGAHFTREAVVALKSRAAPVPFEVRLWRPGPRRLFDLPK